MDDVARVWVGCIAAYNEGKLHGEWVGVESEDQLWGEINRVLKSSPVPNAEEWRFHDWEGFHGYDLGEHMSPVEVVALAELFNEHGEALAKYLEYTGADVDDELADKFTDAYCGHWDSEVDFADNLLEDTGEWDAIPEHLRCYFSVERYARDLFCGDYWSSDASPGVYVFRNY